MNTTPKVSIIIVNYNSSGLIIDCMKSIFSLTHGITFEIIIVDNASEPDIRQKIRDSISQFPDNICHNAIDDQTHTRIINLDRNIGFGRANNEGIKIAEGEYILFLNPDTILINNAIKTLSDFLDTHHDAGACCGNLYGENMLPHYSFRHFLPGPIWDLDELSHNLIEKILYGKDRWHNNSSEPVIIGYASGADIMIRKDIASEIGGFNPAFFMYFEDTDICLRIKRKGWKIYNQPLAKIIHLEGRCTQSAGPVNEFAIKTFEASHHIYHRQNSTRVERSVSNMLRYLFLLSRSILLPGSIKKETYKCHLFYFRKFLCQNAISDQATSESPV